MSAVFLIGAAFALFFALLIVSKDTRRLSDQVLSAWFLLIMLHFLGYYANCEKAYLEYPHLLGIEDAFALLYGPLLFIYTDTLIHRKPVFRKSYFLHFIPFVFANLVYLPFYFTDSSQKTAIYFEHNIGLTAFWYYALITLKLLSGPLYVTWLWCLLKKHRANIQQNFSYMESIDLNWLRRLIFWFAIFLLVVVTSFLTDQMIFPVDSDYITFVALVIFVTAFGYYGFKQGAIFVGREAPANISTKQVIGDNDRSSNVDSGSAKYEKSGLKEDDANRFLDELLTYMKAEQPFLKSTLSIEDVASALDISRHILTQVINQKLGKNFYQFVNEYRVEEAKRKILDPQNQAFTLLAIAYDSGFNSKSSFNTIFKNITGMTPSDFKKSNTEITSLEIQAA